MTEAERKHLSRPFEKSLWNKAVALAAEYRVVIERDDDKTGFIGCTVEMPFAFGEGTTIAACFKDTLQATALSIATMLEDNLQPPSPSRSGKREQQLNIRVGADEKLRLEAAADREGYRSVSDFVRAVALRAT